VKTAGVAVSWLAEIGDSNWPINAPEVHLNNAVLDRAFGLAQGFGSVEWAV